MKITKDLLAYKILFTCNTSSNSILLIAVLSGSAVLYPSRIRLAAVKPSNSEAHFTLIIQKQFKSEICKNSKSKTMPGFVKSSL